MSDRELLELAARAASIPLDYWNDGSEPYSSGEGFILPSNAIWNPLTSDGDALRLSVTLDIQIWRRSGNKVEGIHKDSVLTSPQAEQLIPDPYAATRRAIVRAAAEIGRNMP